MSAVLAAGRPVVEMATRSSSPADVESLAFRPLDHSASLPAPETPGVRAFVRALTGHAKEALVAADAGAAVWRLTSDEGRYFDGADSAPPPLGLFSAGVAASYASELVALAAHRDVPLRRLRLTEDSLYATSGSALRGTISGAALAVEVLVEAATPAGEDELRELARAAIAASPLDGLLRGRHRGRFTVRLDGEDVTPAELHTARGAEVADPDRAFAAIATTGGTPWAEEPMVKVAEGTAAGDASADADRPRSDGQARRPHARAVCTVRDDGVCVVDQFLFQPAGSHFRLLSDAPLGGGGRRDRRGLGTVGDRQGRAPDPLSLVAAGLAFCYMTQLSRYAHLTKLRLDGCRLVQDLPLRDGADGPARLEAPETHVFLDACDDADAARRMAVMAERMCFLHALCGTPVDVRLTVRRRSA